MAIPDKRRCDKCGELGVQEHHIVPIGLGEDNGDVVPLCLKHHKEIHRKLLKTVEPYLSNPTAAKRIIRVYKNDTFGLIKRIWKFVGDKRGAVFAIKEETKYWLKQNGQ